MFKNKILLTLLAILLLGSFLRFFALGETSFSADEFLDINSSYGYAQTGEWQAWDFNQEKLSENQFAPRDERAWGYKIQVASLFKFLPPTEAVARSISALWGVLTIALIFFIASKFTKNQTIGLIAAFLFAISPDALEFDRTLRMYAMFFPVFLAFSWTLFNTFEKEYEGNIKLLSTVWKKLSINTLYFIPMIILGIVSLHLHLLTANIAIVLFLYFFVNAKLKYWKEKNYLNKYSVYTGLGLMAVLSVLILFSSKLQVATKEIGWGINHYSYLEKAFSDYAHTLLAFAFLLLGSFFLWKNKLQKESLWLSVSFWGILILAIFFWDRNVGSQYIFFAQSFKMILIASGIYFSAIFLKDNLKNYPKAFFSVLIINLILVPNYAYFFQENNTYKQTSTSDNPNYRKVFDFFKKNKEATDALITREVRNYYWSGTKTQTYNLGGEITKDKLDMARIVDIISKNPSGWIIFSDNDEVFISKDVQEMIEKNMEKVSNSQVRGKISVYRWQ